MLYKANKLVQEGRKKKQSIGSEHKRGSEGQEKTKSLLYTYFGYLDGEEVIALKTNTFLKDFVSGKKHVANYSLRYTSFWSRKLVFENSTCSKKKKGEKKKKQMVTKSHNFQLKYYVIGPSHFSWNNVAQTGVPAKQASSTYRQQIPYILGRYVRVPPNALKQVLHIFCP